MRTSTPEDRLCAGVEGVLVRHGLEGVQVRDDPEVRRPSAAKPTPAAALRGALRSVRGLAPAASVVALVCIFMSAYRTLVWAALLAALVGLGRRAWSLWSQRGSGVAALAKTRAEVVLWMGETHLSMRPETKSAVRALGPGFGWRIEVPSDSDARPEDAQFAVVWQGRLGDVFADGEAKGTRRAIGCLRRAIAPTSTLTLLCATVALLALLNLAWHWKGHYQPQDGLWRVLDAVRYDLGR